jgi:hypothetical protein
VMQSSEDITNKSRDLGKAARETIWRMLVDPSFYSIAPTFISLKKYMHDLAEMKRKSFEVDCSTCLNMKIYHAFRMGIDHFAKIFFHLYDTGRMDELEAVRQYLGKLARDPRFRFTFAYMGPCTQNVRRQVILEPRNGHT